MPFGAKRSAVPVKGENVMARGLDEAAITALRAAVTEIEPAETVCLSDHTTTLPPLPSGAPYPAIREDLRASLHGSGLRVGDLVLGEILRRVWHPLAGPRR